MSRSAHTDACVDRFLKTQRLRHPETRRIYGHLLRAFERHVFASKSPSVLSVKDIRRWLRERRKEWPLHMVYIRARLVERFVGWLHTQGVIVNNPFEELHCRYGTRTATIVRAMVSEDADAELARLRPVERFGSFLGDAMRSHVDLMRSLGYRYRAGEGMLLRFDRFLQEHPNLSTKSLAELVSIWSEDQPTSGRLREAGKVERTLSRVLHRLDPSVPVSKALCDVEGRFVQRDRKPHVYSDEDIGRLLRAALSLPSPKAQLRPISIFTMLILAYCAGLRRGEIARLRLRDVDLDESSVDIRDTKFFKHRRLPLQPAVMAAVRDYLDARQKAGAPTSRDASLFWNDRLGAGYTYGGMWHLLVKVLRRAGLKPDRGRIGPRIHDLRHSMASHRLRDWYKEGINPESQLPHLATYLGHKDIQSTLVYLHSTPELMEEASERFRKVGVAVLGATGDDA
jgi:integrase/recombinase XerD